MNVLSSTTFISSENCLLQQRDALAALKEEADVSVDYLGKLVEALEGKNGIEESLQESIFDEMDKAEQMIDMADIIMIKLKEIIENNQNSIVNCSTSNITNMLTQLKEQNAIIVNLTDTVNAQESEETDGKLQSTEETINRVRVVRDLCAGMSQRLQNLIDIIGKAFSDF